MGTVDLGVGVAAVDHPARVHRPGDDGVRGASTAEEDEPGDSCHHERPAHCPVLSGADLWGSPQSHRELPLEAWPVPFVVHASPPRPLAPSPSVGS